ncbi:MAG TPA: hypothetical protein VNW06_10635 [Cytophagaceae bacterium]|jgi:hypothetical protein|nr:hypothetical protein [Cytophagaceae bacterium]
MTKSKDDTQQVAFPDKWLKKLPTGFADDADSMSDDDLKKVIVGSEKNISTIEKEKEEDVKLSGAKDIIKDLSVPYRDAKNCQTAKIKYALFLLENRGVDLDNS